MRYSIAKGVFDILPEDPDPEGLWRESHRWQYVEKMAREFAYRYNFLEIRTPLFENTALFERSIGTDTDIVSKEMYTFLDRANRSLTLRPEGTAPVMRAFIEKHLNQRAAIHKFFYIYPMFRYERQQAGRYRQHHQFGIEAIGADCPLQDAEVIDLLFHFLKELGLSNLTIHLNSIGNQETRHHFRSALKSYLTPFLPELSSESQTRFETNPLRILDSKNPHDKAILKEAPTILEFLDESSQKHHEKLAGYLDALDIPYMIDPLLVRGLDYYTKTVFEITTQALGAQNAIGGGGRYDGLMQELGGPDMPAFGFGAGLERIILAMLAQNAPFPAPAAPTYYFIALGERAEKVAMHLLSKARKIGHSAVMDFSNKKLKASLRAADACHARFAIIIGDEELDRGEFVLKNMATTESENLSTAKLTEHIHSYHPKETKNHGL